MNNFLRTIIAGYGAKKLGGGCFSTIIIFFLIYWGLGTCNSHPNNNPSHVQYQVPANQKVVKNIPIGRDRTTAQL